MEKKKRGKTGGRQAGTPNKVNATVKMMVLAALEAKGGVEWLKKQMDKEPVAYMTLLGKIMPTQVVGDVSYRYVARIPAPEKDPKAWLKTWAPPLTHPAPATKQ